jgi:hypothetical protein
MDIPTRRLIMNFKNYLTEKNNSSVKILNFIRFKHIPISPKFFEDVFGEREKYCFVSMKANRIQSLYNRQGKKNQISTFTDFKSKRILWGADGLDWYGDTVVAVLKGKVTLEGNTDLWTQYDSQGRRWVDLNDLDEMKITGDKVSEVLLKAGLEIYDEFLKKYGNYLDPKVTSNGKLKEQYIKDFFDISYKYLKKYKNLLSQAVEGTLVDYNEVLCYSYKIEELLIFDNNDESDYTIHYTKPDKKILKKLKVKKFTDINDLIKELKKYQARNKK